jgi:hypothetical protein
MLRMLCNLREKLVGVYPCGFCNIKEFDHIQPPLAALQRENMSASLRASKDGPSLEIEDSQGYKATVGSTGLVTPRTGETHNTSAATVLLFDKQKNVIWKAPE